MIKGDPCVTFYDETQPMHLQRDASEIRLRAALLQTRSDTSCSRDKVPDNSMLRTITFASKSLSSVERRYSSIEREALDILHDLKTFHYYCFVSEVHIITDHKLLAAIFKEDVAMLSHRIQ